MSWTPPPEPPRRARLVLTTPDGALVGATPALAVETPWWQHVEPVVDRARHVLGIDVVILRILSADRPGPHGGEVTYLAEIAKPAPAVPWSGAMEDHPLRLRYARPGGPAEDLAWAQAALAERGLKPIAAPIQVRTWNLSSLWRLPVEGRTVWLKCAPPFMAHEAALLRRLSGARTPAVLTAADGRALMAEIPGEDLYAPTEVQALAMVDLLTDLQRAWVGRVPALLRMGLPDWRSAALIEAITGVVSRTAAELDEQDRATLSAFVEALPACMDAVQACGLPDTLVHGDFHPGNFRGEGLQLTLLDWSDSGVGHPLLDLPTFIRALPPELALPVWRHWISRWRQALPESDPKRAATLLAPVAAARMAAVYQRFLDNIEPSEHPYHRADPAEWLRRTAALVRGAPG